MSSRRFKLGQNEAAIKDYDEALKLNPKLTDAHFNRGNVHFAEKQYERAVKDYDEVIKNDPKAARAYIQRGLAHNASGSFSDRWIHLRATPGKCPFLTGIDRLAQAAEHFGDAKTAIAAYTKVLRLSSDPSTKAQIRAKIKSLRTSSANSGG